MIVKIGELFFLNYMYKYVPLTKSIINKSDSVGSTSGLTRATLKLEKLKQKFTY